MAIPALISSLITERPLCLECIANKVDLSIMAVDEALTVIARVMQISAVPDSPCLHCRELRITFCIGGRPEAAPEAS